MVVPKAALERLTRYRRCLERLMLAGRTLTSSREIAEHLELTPATVRKDLARFGHFGSPGTGYQVGRLAAAIEDILAVRGRGGVVVLGSGSLVGGIAGPEDLLENGFHVMARFDPTAQGTNGNGADVPAYHPSQIRALVPRLGARLAIIATPDLASPRIMEDLAAAGITGVLNLTAVPLHTPLGMTCRRIDICSELAQLSFRLHHQTA